ncbi:MAG: phosphatidylserine decarboxylase family protein, partial [Lentisphaerae bacterium]|nr:phosphatidylserine decarboxylase family protein [Lentisphaerota bacterium]
RPFVLASVILGLLIIIGLCFCLTCKLALGIGIVFAAVSSGYFLFFFRDPERISPSNDEIVVSGADGTIASITKLREDTYLKTNCVRISIFLSLFDVHVNRAPISGKSVFLGYFPGKRFFTFQEKSSEFNQHNKILIENDRIKCLVNQIVGPVCRRVVYWLPNDKPANVAMGERIGMMKFGSRLDIYLPADKVEATVKKGDKVRAGETVVAKIIEKTS